MLPKFAYFRAGSLDEAVKQLAATDGAQVYAGGTDLIGCLREHIFAPPMVVSISKLKDLHGVRKTSDGGLRIGAMTTITEVSQNPLIQEMYPGLAQAASEVASPQLRNQGTIGGNICQKPRCWYYRGEFHCLRKGGDLCYAVGGENQFHCIFGGDFCYIVHPSDTAPALVALEAAARVAGPKGFRNIPLEEFHMPPGKDATRETVLEPGEIVAEILLPPMPEGLKSSYRKVRARRSWDFALAGAALALQFDAGVVKKARVVLSGAAPVPWRSKAVEEAVTGGKLDEAAIAKAADAAVEGAKPMEKNGYKIALFRGVIQEELAAMAG